MSMTILPSHAVIGSKITIRSCDGTPVDTSQIKIPEKATCFSEGNIFDGTWIEDGKEKYFVTYKLIAIARK